MTSGAPVRMRPPHRTAATVAGGLGHGAANRATSLGLAHPAHPGLGGRSRRGAPLLAAGPRSAEQHGPSSASWSAALFGRGATISRQRHATAGTSRRKKRLTNGGKSPPCREMQATSHILDNFVVKRPRPPEGGSTRSAGDSAIGVVPDLAGMNPATAVPSGFWRSCALARGGRMIYRRRRVSPHGRTSAHAASSPKRSSTSSKGTPSTRISSQGRSDHEE